MPDDKNAAQPSATFMLREVLKGDLLNSFQGDVTAHAVEEIMKEARHRLKSGAIWILSCTMVKRIMPDGQSALRNAFGEFRRAGGAKIVVTTTDAHVAGCVRMAAKGFVSLDLQVVATFGEALAIGKAYRDARDKKRP